MLHRQLSSLLKYFGKKCIIVTRNVNHIAYRSMVECNFNTIQFQTILLLFCFFWKIFSSSPDDERLITFLFLFFVYYFTKALTVFVSQVTLTSFIISLTIIYICGYVWYLEALGSNILFFLAFYPKSSFADSQTNFCFFYLLFLLQISIIIFIIIIIIIINIIIVIVINVGFSPAQRFIALCSFPAVPNSAVSLVLGYDMSPMPKRSIDLMSRFGTVPRDPITTGRMAVSTWWILFTSNARSWYFSTFQSSVLTTLMLPGTAISMIVHFRISVLPRIISGLLCATVMSVWIVSSQYNSTSSFSTTSVTVWVFQSMFLAQFPMNSSGNIVMSSFLLFLHQLGATTN